MSTMVLVARARLRRGVLIRALSSSSSSSTTAAARRAFGEEEASTYPKIGALDLLLLLESATD